MTTGELGISSLPYVALGQDVGRAQGVGAVSRRRVGNRRLERLEAGRVQLQRPGVQLLRGRLPRLEETGEGGEGGVEGGRVADAARQLPKHGQAEGLEVVALVRRGQEVDERVGDAVVAVAQRRLGAARGQGRRVLDEAADDLLAVGSGSGSTTRRGRGRGRGRGLVYKLEALLADADAGNVPCPAARARLPGLRAIALDRREGRMSVAAEARAKARARGMGMGMGAGGGAWCCQSGLVPSSSIYDTSRSRGMNL